MEKTEVVLRDEPSRRPAGTQMMLTQGVMCPLEVVVGAQPPTAPCEQMRSARCVKRVPFLAGRALREAFTLTPPSAEAVKQNLPIVIRTSASCLVEEADSGARATGPHRGERRPPACHAGVADSWFAASGGNAASRRGTEVWPFPNSSAVSS